MANNTAKSRITISGTCPQFNADELQSRQDRFHHAYHETALCCELVRGDIPLQLLTNVIEKAAQGYVLNTKYPVVLGEMNYVARMTKPLPLQELDLIAADEQIKQEYIVEVEGKRAEFKEALKQQLLQKAESDEQKKVDEKRAKLLADIEKQVEDTFAPLAIPA